MEAEIALARPGAVETDVAVEILVDVVAVAADAGPVAEIDGAVDLEGRLVVERVFEGRILEVVDGFVDLVHFFFVSLFVLHLLGGLVLLGREGRGKFRIERPGRRGYVRSREPREEEREQSRNETKGATEHRISPMRPTPIGAQPSWSRNFTGRSETRRQFRFDASEAVCETIYRGSGHHGLPPEHRLRLLRARRRPFQLGPGARTVPRKITRSCS